MLEPFEIAERIKLCAKERKITVKYLLKESGVGEKMVSNMSGKNGSYPQSDKIAKIANSLNCSIDYLLGLTDEPTQNEPEVSSKNLHGNESVADLMNNIENNAKVMNIKGLQRLSDYSDDLIGNPTYTKPEEEQPKITLALKIARSNDDRPMEMIEVDEEKLKNAPKKKL